MPSNNLFICCHHEETKLAELIDISINNAFDQQISCYIAAKDIRGGKLWKEEIKRKLKECSGIIIVATPKLVKSPWIYIEWTAFWLKNKEYYILMPNESIRKDLVVPMLDRQHLIMFNSEQMEGLFKDFQLLTTLQKNPIKAADKLAHELECCYLELAEADKQKGFEKYRNNYDILPSNDDELINIALYFYQNKDYDIFNIVIKKILNDEALLRIARLLITKKDFTNLQFLLNEFFSGRRGTDKLFSILIDLIISGHIGGEIYNNILYYLSKLNQTELRKLAIFLLQNGYGDDKYFDEAINLIKNPTITRQVGVYLLSDKEYFSKKFKFIVDTLLKTLSYKEIRILLETAINEDFHNDSNVLIILKILKNNNPEEYDKLLNDINSINTDKYNYIKKQMHESA